jgi:hypothetical protein
MSYQPKVYREQGGDKTVVASGGEIEIQSGATLDLQAGAVVTNNLTAAAVNVAADSIQIVDASDSNALKTEAIADLVSAMAGTGLQATAGVLATNEPVGGATFSVGTEGTDAIIVGVQLKTEAGVDIAHRGVVHAYLSDDANGDSLVASAPSGGVAIGTDGLAIPLVANKAFLLTSEADGDIDLSITEAGAKTCYLAVVLPNGKLTVSGAITFAT